MGFVDDTVMFFENQDEIRIIENIINQFEKSTNAKLNKDKTSIISMGERKTKCNLKWAKEVKELKILGLTYKKTCN